MRTIVLCAVLALFAPNAFAQNRFFADGESGLAMSGGWVTGSGAGGIGGGLVLTLGGRLDLGVNYALLYADNSAGSWQEISPTLGVAVFRPDAGRPLGADLVAGYTSIDFGGALSNVADGDARYIGGEFHGHFGNSPDVQLVPALLLAYARAHGELRTNTYGYRMSETVEGPLIGLELTLRIRGEFLFRPSATLFDDDTTLALMAGFALPFVFGGGDHGSRDTTFH